MNAGNARVADLARLNSLLGELYADGVLADATALSGEGRFGWMPWADSLSPGTGGGIPRTASGRYLAEGRGRVIAARVGVPVVSDFRPADMAAGGKGAPLVPYLDYLLFRDATIGRIVQNIGGIANLTAIPAGAGAAVLCARHGAGEYGDRWRDGRATWQAIRSRRKDCRVWGRDRLRYRSDIAGNVLSGSTTEDCGP